MKTLKKIAALACVAAVMTTASAFAVDVSVNNALINFDVEPRIINDRTMVPIRATFEVLGADVDWDGNTQTVTATRGNNKISLTIGSDVMSVNGNPKTLDSPPVMVDDRTLVPIRAISEALGSEVVWDNLARSVNITDNSGMVDLSATTKYAPAWKTAYADFLNGKIGNFELIYLTDDDIPEIVIAEDGYRLSYVNIYTYSDGAVKAIEHEDGYDSFGAYGTINYKERGNLIYISTGGSEITYIFTNISDNIAHTEHILVADGNNGTITWNGGPIDMSTFQNETKRMSAGYKSAGYATGKSINSANIKAALGL